MKVGTSSGPGFVLLTVENTGEVLTTQLVSTLAEPFQRATARIHGDLKIENCLSAWGSIVLVDWELFGLGDPALEIAGFLHAERAALAPASGEAWLDSYLDAMDQPGLRARIGVFRQLLPLQDLCFLLVGLRDVTPADRAQPEYAAAATFLAQTLLAGIGKGRFMIITGAEGKFIYVMKRHFPALVAWIMDRDVRKAAAKGA